jgi:quercetin dioxygenase-like cupin family protein
VFGQAADTYYFDEHYHIDAHHGRMAFENVVVPAVARYGESAAVEIVRGLEEVRLLTGIADEDFMAQIAWFDKAGEHKAMAAEIGKRLSESGAACSRTTEVGGAGRQSVMRVSDKDELLVVESGAVECVAGHGQTIELRAGESLVAPGNRMRAVKIVSDTAVYHFYEIEDHKLWLS